MLTTGYIFSAILLGEEITKYDVAATLFVFTGLYLSGNLRINRLPKQLTEKKVEA
jgi:probable blue pigment (indigoidine) exporter